MAVKYPLILEYPQSPLEPGGQCSSYQVLGISTMVSSPALQKIMPEINQYQQILKLMVIMFRLGTRKALVLLSKLSIF